MTGSRRPRPKSPSAPGLLPLLVLLALLPLGACARSEPAAEPAAGEGGPAYGDTLVEASIGDISGLIPNITSDSASHEIGNLIYANLVRTDKELRLEGELAERWEISRDELTITFHLRKGVKWHDGVEVTAEDVDFTYRYMIDPKTPTAYAESFRQIRRAEVVDRHTYRVTYEKPYAPGLLSWGIWILPRHILEGPWKAGVDLRTTPQNRHPVGSGPYRFREWKTGEKVVLEANPDYFEGRPYIKRVVYRIIPDQSTIFLELKARNIDMAGLSPIQYRRQTDYPAFRKAFNRYRYLANAYAYLGFNLLDPRFQDKRVRQAMASAINKPEIIEGVLLGLGRPAVGPYKPGTWWYKEHVKTYPFDPERAKALLAEAGWKDTDGDGLLDKDGQPFRFTIRTNQGNLVRQQTAEIVQRRLRAVGIDVQIHVVEWAAFINTFIRKKNFEAIILGWGLGMDPDQYDIWHSSKTGPDELNHISYKNPKVDALLEAGRRTFDEAKRKAIYGELQDVLAEEQPVVFLYVPDALPVVSARVRGIEPAPAGISYNFTKWYVPANLQRYTR
ncbi:MAG: peptide-binding protein [candidate division NC10 bacterium]|nr:peptide-binding protein [candidate division NC10 bacterium]